MKATYKQYFLNFKKPSGTSRGILNSKETWFIILEHDGKKGIGECGLLRGLSCDDVPEYEDKLKWVCDNIYLGIEKLYQELVHFPSIQFGLEMAFLSLQSENPFVLFPSNFTNGQDVININGLIWMDEKEAMKAQIEEKLSLGFTCIKLKIGAINFNQELELLSFIREHFNSKTIEIRVDTNGAFSLNDALDKLKQLSQYDLHSIEQPIAVNQWEEMAKLCLESPVPIALDEELIGIYSIEKKIELLNVIQPQFLIFKPSFIGGIKGTLEWIKLCEERNINWWITSALESNIGLNAIAQFTYLQINELPQGLGTGALYTNNFDSPLQVINGKLNYNKNIDWHCNLL